ncbi:hypothetical protein HPB50_012140 [Hyalomma asiaticum]|uniref:Uncharacterized protein n=1 Tax=Hyalomma asiaticum TaxID=266040 RepID=A0ACB7TF89_HYAAI|nr:hypothetical protein HPB50_012140 [Hyalomma asiaticum]
MRPESFAIYKRTRPGSPWVPYQYYSSTCHDTYGLQPSSYATRDDETKALCTGEYSGLSPLSGGNVAFSTLEGRPSAFHFEQSKLLQEWVTATAIRIVLTRLNTFGDEIFGDKQVLRSYYYAIADLAVGGRCQCNGHAIACDPGPGGERQRVCRCEHNTAGDNCERCKDLYNDQEWGRATSTNAHECQLSLRHAHSGPPRRHPKQPQLVLGPTEQAEEGPAPEPASCGRPCVGFSRGQTGLLGVRRWLPRGRCSAAE